MAKSIEIKKLSLTDANTVVNNVIEILFSKNETTDEISYRGYYNEILRVYFEMIAAYPDLKVHEIEIDDFFNGYCDGKYDEYIEIMKNDRRIQYIEDTLNNTIQNLIKYYSGEQLANSVTKLINNLNGVVETYSDSIEGVGKSDIIGFFKNFADFASTNNPETITEAVLKKKKTTPKSKKATQTGNKKADE